MGGRQSQLNPLKQFVGPIHEFGRPMCGQPATVALCTIRPDVPLSRRRVRTVPQQLSAGTPGRRGAFTLTTGPSPPDAMAGRHRETAGDETKRFAHDGGGRRLPRLEPAHTRALQSDGRGAEIHQARTPGTHERVGPSVPAAELLERRKQRVGASPRGGEGDRSYMEPVKGKGRTKYSHVWRSAPNSIQRPISTITA